MRPAAARDAVKVLEAVAGARLALNIRPLLLLPTQFITGAVVEFIVHFWRLAIE